MIYLSAASTISHQPAFGNAGFSSSIQPLAPDSALIAPDYKSYIEAGLLRRMSKILRMSVACAKDCLQTAQVEQPDAIVVGTGLGCLQDTEKFLINTITIEGLLPPTSFIQSTHNTLAGQISLSLGNHAYNMTHTQNTVSFEHAIIDATLLIAEGATHVLAGSGDEYIELLDDIAAHLQVGNGRQLTSGASFFLLSNQPGANTKAAIADVAVFRENDNTGVLADHFLSQNNLKFDDIDLVLFAAIDTNLANAIRSALTGAGLDASKCIDYLPLTGLYPTASSFAVHVAADQIAHNPDVGKVLVWNALSGKNVGLTLIQSVEA